jgi:hypothetical protein
MTYETKNIKDEALRDPGHPLVETMVAILPMAGVTEVTEENWKDVFARVRVVDALYGPFRIHAATHVCPGCGGEVHRPEPRLFVPAEIKSMVGFRMEGPLAFTHVHAWARILMCRALSQQAALCDE